MGGNSPITKKGGECPLTPLLPTFLCLTFQEQRLGAVLSGGYYLYAFFR